MTIDPDFRLPEPESGEEGTVLYSTEPIVKRDVFRIVYLHTLAQNSFFFEGLSQGDLVGSRELATGFTYATPRSYDLTEGRPTAPHELPDRGYIHTHTTCYKVGENFRDEAPFHLAMIEFEDVETLLLGRVYGCDEEDLEIGMEVRAKFRRLSNFDITDVYFVPTGEFK